MVSERVQLREQYERRANQYLLAAVIFGSLYVVLSLVCPG